MPIVILKTPVLPELSDVFEALSHVEARRRHYRLLQNDAEFEKLMAVVAGEMKLLQLYAQKLLTERATAPAVLAECDQHEKHLFVTRAKCYAQLAQKRQANRSSSAPRPKAPTKPLITEEEYRKYETECSLTREQVDALFNRIVKAPRA